MCRLIDAGKSCGRWLRRPVAWLVVATWAGVFLVVHFMVTLGPTRRIEITDLLPAPKCDDPFAVAAGDLDPIFYLVSAEKNIACTSLPPPRQGTGPAPFPQPPYRLFDLSYRALLVEFLDDGTWVEGPLRGDWIALSKHFEVNGEQDTQTWFRHVRSGQVSMKIPWRQVFRNQFAISDNNRWVAFEGERGFTIFELGTPFIRTIKYPKLNGSSVTFCPSAVSRDGKLLAGTEHQSLFVLDATCGEVVKRWNLDVDNPTGSDEVTFAPDCRALAWQYGESVYLLDLPSDRHPLELPKASGPVWQIPGTLLVTREQSKGVWRVEIWGEDSLKAEWAMPQEKLGVPPVLTPSPDGRNVLVTRLIENESHAPEWILKLFEKILGIAPPPCRYWEAYLLDSRTLVEIHHWRMCPDQWVDSIQFTADGKQIVVSNGATIEYWPIPPRSWFRSTASAAGITVALLFPVALWRFGRRRKRNRVAMSPR